MRAGKKVIPKMFNPSEPISMRFFSQLANVNPSAITKAVDTHKVVLNDDGLIDCRDFRNSGYLIKHITKSILCGTEEEKNYRQAVLRVLITHSKIDIETPAKEYNYDKLPHDKTFNIGIIQDDEFIPIVSLTKFELKSDEIMIQPLDFELSIGLKKGKLSDLFYGQHNMGQLFSSPA